MRGILYMPGHALAAIAFLVGIVAVGFAAGWFELTLGSFVLWGIPIGVALATAANWLPAAQVIGPIYSLVWGLALIAWLITLIV